MPKISEEKKQQKKLEMIQGAAILFAQNGYNKTSVNDIVKMCNCSKGSFYTYYDSKESLFFDIVHGADKKIIYRGIENKDGNGFSSISKYIEFRLRSFFDEKNKIGAKYTFEFWSSTTLTELQVKALQKRYSAFEKDLLEIIESGQMRGIFRSEIDASAFIQIVFAMIDGLIMYDTVLYRPISEEVIETTVKIVHLYLDRMRGNNEDKSIST